MDQQATRQGFFYGYLIVGASSIIQMMFLSCMFAYGVLFKELEAEFGWSRAAIAGAPSLMMLMMGTLGIFLGRVNDVAGPRLLLTLTGVLYGVGFMLMYQMNSLWSYTCFWG
jgi:OFA family oxalate/formate antiporter-like MFS transporter